MVQSVREGEGREKRLRQEKNNLRYEGNKLRQEGKKEVREGRKYREKYEKNYWRRKKGVQK